MVVLYSKSGQLGNRLWQASYFIANAIEYDYSFLHLGFTNYLEYYNESISGQLKEMGRDIIFRDYKSTPLKYRLIIKYATVSEKLKYNLPFIREIKLKTNTIKYDISRSPFINMAKNKILLIDGWRFVDYEALKKHAGIIRKIFTPNKVFLENVAKLKNDEFRKFDKMIGVHIRGGDYANFLQGRWFYSIEEYVAFMDQVRNLPRFKNMHLGFYICSNEAVDLNHFRNFNIVKSSGSFIEDLHGLSLCDLIIGPPSTYSGWAAFYGKAPLLFLQHKEMKLSETQIENMWETLSY
jgi:hypothetical protein